MSHCLNAGTYCQIAPWGGLKHCECSCKICMPLTADTIQDSDIRDLYERREVSGETATLAMTTNERNRQNEAQRNARALCAEIMNRRGK